MLNIVLESEYSDSGPKVVMSFCRIVVEMSGIQTIYVFVEEW